LKMEKPFDRSFRCFTMTYPREVLNRLKWGREGLSHAVITYVHRGAPGDLAIISGEEILGLGRSFFTVGNGQIPYHRITRIENEGEVVYQA
jgi:uncharacterized protein (UPF0248 family)